MLIEIAQIILLISASALCFFLIIYFKKITQSIVELKIELQKISEQLTPVINSFHSLSKSITNLTDEVKNQFDKTKWIIDEVKERVESILNFEKKIQKGIEEPVNNLISNLNALKKGFQVFWEKIKNN